MQPIHLDWSWIARYNTLLKLNKFKYLPHSDEAQVPDSMENELSAANEKKNVENFEQYY